MNEAYYTFPAVKGVQASTEYYVSMVPLAILPRLFMFSDEELPPELRAQRILNKRRIPEMRDYILNNPTSYVFSSLTVSVDGHIEFEPVEKDSKVGKINIPMSARFIINDGQHRKAAIEAAIKENPILKYEDISVVFFADMGLKRSQQIFSDLNRYAIRPTKSLNVLFDSRDGFSSMICNMIEELEVYKGWVEKERSTLPNRSKALFTLSGIYHGTEELVNGLDFEIKELKKFVYCFWSDVYEYMPDWQLVISGKKKASELRKESLAGHTIALLAIGRVGNLLIKNYNRTKPYLNRLLSIDWNKDNPEWNGKVVVGGHITASRGSIQALTDTIYKTILEG